MPTINLRSTLQTGANFYFAWQEDYRQEKGLSFIRKASCQEGISSSSFYLNSWDQ